MSEQMSELKLVLASTSPFRKELLARLKLPFETVDPEVDETPRPGELPHQMAERLARSKAESVADQFPDALIIGSDQVATLDGLKPIGKPGDMEHAKAQLVASSGREVTFFTGLCLHNTRDSVSWTDVIPYKVHFRELTDQQIENYILLDHPENCAGSFKCESLGVALFQSMEGEDPTSLIGLPLIRLSEWLITAGRSPL